MEYYRRRTEKHGFAKQNNEQNELSAFLVLHNTNDKSPQTTERKTVQRVPFAAPLVKSGFERYSSSDIFYTATYTATYAPEDIFKRHDNCGCTTIYENGRQRQDVWTKKSWETPEIEDMEYKPTVFNSAEAKALEKKNLQYKDVDNSVKNDIIKEKEDLRKYIGQSITETDNQHVREWYYANVSDIPNQINRDKSFIEQVHEAFDLRNKYKRQARIAMTDIETVEELEKKRPVPEFEELVKNKMKRKGMTRQEALEDILETASKTNPDVNKEFGL